MTENAIETFPPRRMLVARMFLWVFAGDAVSKVAILVTSLVAVRALAPVEFGLYLGLSATAILAASLWDLGVSTVLTREVAAGRANVRDAVAQSASVRLRTLPIWVVSFLAGSVILGRSEDVAAATFVAFGLASLVIATHTLVLSILRAWLRFKTASGALALGRWVTALASLPALGFGDPMVILAGALLLGETATLIASLVAVAFPTGPTRPTAEGGGTGAPTVTVRAALPFAANSVLNLAYNRFDIVILAALSSSEQLGFYAPASRIQDAFFLIPVAISVIALPLISREWKAGQGAQVTRSIMKQLTAFGLGLSVPATILIFVYTPEIISFVLGEEYVGAVTATRILIWSLPLSAVTSVLVAALAGSGHALDTTRIYVVAFTVATVMHLSLDWWWGATGAAVASLSRDPAALFVAVVYARRAGLIGLQMPLKPPRSGGRAPSS